MQTTKTITDHFTIQGHSLKHLEVGCQDYAYSFKTPDLDVAIVSDGCSSAPNSDVGARLLVITAGHILAQWLPTELEEKPEATLEQLQMTFETLLVQQLDALFVTFNRGTFLGPLLLDCTLTVAVRYKERAFVFMFGDGFIGADYLDGSFDLIRREYTATLNGLRCSAPAYPAYKMIANRERWVKYQTAGVEEETEHYRFQDNVWQPGLCTTTPYVGNAFGLEFDFSKVRSLIVSSDGLASFDESKTRLREDVVSELMRFPANAKGQILRRKMLFNSSRVWPGKGWKHQDDLGLAGILKQ